MNAWSGWLRVLLPWSCLAVLPFGRVVEAPMGVMAVGGLVLLARRPAAWLREPGPALLLAVFINKVQARRFILPGMLVYVTFAPLLLLCGLRPGGRLWIKLTFPSHCLASC